MTTLTISARSIRRVTIESALESVSADRETLTADDVREAADVLEHEVSRHFGDIAAALRASAADMDRPVRIADVLASWDSGMLRDAATYARLSSQGTQD
jgi:hypothetical protein